MNRIIQCLIAMCLLGGVVAAQKGGVTNAPPALGNDLMAGMIVEGVRVPYYDEQGALQAVFFGGRAKGLGSGVADVTNIRIDLYEDDEVVMTVYAPQCYSRMLEEGSTRTLSVESEGDVLIEMKEIAVVGRGFRIQSDRNRFEILSEAKVIVKEDARKSTELMP